VVVGCVERRLDEKRGERVDCVPAERAKAGRAWKKKLSLFSLREVGGLRVCGFWGGQSAALEAKRRRGSLTRGRRA